MAAPPPSFPSPEGLSQTKLMKLVRDDRLRASKEWNEESLTLLEQSVSQMKSEYEADCKSKLDAERKTLIEKVYRQFAELMKQSGKEIESYISIASEEKQQKFSFLQEHAQKLAKKRSPRAPAAVPEPLPVFQQDLEAVFGELRESGVDVMGLTILADNCFLFQGHVFTVGDPVQIETRNAGKMIQAVVATVTTGEIDFEFRDNTGMTIEREDLVSGRIVITPNV